MPAKITPEVNHG